MNVFLFSSLERASGCRETCFFGPSDAGRQTTDGDESRGWTTRLMLESKPGEH
jgi:hypothetical protein